MAGAPKGNKNAAKSRPWAHEIEKFTTQNPDKRRRVIEKLFKMAEEGNMLAIKEIMDRVEGKSPQSLTLSGHISTSEMSTADILAELASLNESSETPRATH